MAARQRHVIDADDLTDADKQILDALHRGARTKGAIIDETGLHRNTVGMRLDVLEAGDVVERIHDRTALYELADDPRAGATADGESPRARSGLSQGESTNADLHELHRTVDDLEAAIERGDRASAETALRRLREGLGDEN